MTVAHYLDTSALVKLAVAAPETPALREWLVAQSRPLVSCNLARTELLRSVRCIAPDRVVMARLVLDSLVLMEVTAEIFEAAGRLDATTGEPLAAAGAAEASRQPEATAVGRRGPDAGRLRSLDAVHLAAALDLGDDLDTLVTYDERLASGARSYGVPVTAPA